MKKHIKSSAVNLKNALFAYWPLLLLLILNLALFATNYVPGTYLTGWDNLHPEFNPLLNIKRSIFAVWQEYQSLGLLGGMGHATDLVRQIYVLLLLFIFPENLVRYMSTFTALFLGGSGAYYLIRLILAQAEFDNNRAKAASFLGALFYTLNIATIQTFYVPFEAFFSHFAALPWLLLSSLIFLTKPNFKSFLFLVVVLALSTPASYIPTLFVASMIALSILIAAKFIFEKKRKSFFITSLKLYATIFAVNSFWLLPFLYFTLTNSAVNVSAKMNQMATDTIFAQNREFGNLLDVALLRGFWFNNIDPGLSGNFSYMLAPFRIHFGNPLVIAAALFLFGIAVVGVILAILRTVLNHKAKEINHKSILPFVALFLFGFTMLATDAPVAGTINDLFRKIPLFDQAFRFPFTKFNSLAALAYSIMLAVGFTFITELIYRRVKKFLPYILFLIPAAALLFVAYPSFTGNLFYEKETIEIPNEYFETFKYFENADTNARIANFPQPTFWGWTFYRWGYGGSGFLWYGIKQPILDRAFDVWSSFSENYYFEISQALYSKDNEAFISTINKYQIKYLLVDKNVIYPTSPRSLVYAELESLIKQNEDIKLSASFGNIDIYEVALSDNPNSFVYAKEQLPSIVNSKLNTADFAYRDFGTYITNLNGNNRINIFGSLFSQKERTDRDYSLYDQGTTIEITKALDLKQNYALTVPDFSTLSNIIPITLFASKSATTNQIRGEIKTPEILVDREKVYGRTIIVPLFSVDSEEDLTEVTLNGVANFEIDNAREEIGTGFLTLSQINRLALVGPETSESTTIDARSLLGEDTTESIEIEAGIREISVVIPKVDDDYLSFSADIENAEIEDCNDFRNGTVKSSKQNGVLNITTQNDTSCISFFAGNLLHTQAYALFSEGVNSSGRPFHFWVLNEDLKSSVLDTYLDGELGSEYILPPQGTDGRGYSFHFDNVALGTRVAQNSLSSFTAYPIPFEFVTSLALETGDIKTSNASSEIKSVSHPNESLYIVELSESRDMTLVLSQSYDAGWHAYKISDINFLTTTFPFFFGKTFGEHVKVNNWSNGWTVNNVNESEKIVLVYLPQYLEYSGFALLFVIFILLIVKLIRIKRSKKHA